MNDQNNENNQDQQPEEPINIQTEDLYVLQRINDYLDLLLEYNKEVNLVSRQITRFALNQLINETLQLNNYIREDIILDAGSGNGILGIPLAFLNPDKEIFLIEPRLQKSTYLQKIVDRMVIKNVRVNMASIEEFLSKTFIEDVSLVARGFPNHQVLTNLIKKKKINQAIVITSVNKIKKNQINMAKVKQKTYNVPLRKNLKILKMENVSRET